MISLAYFVYFEGGPTGETLGKKALRHQGHRHPARAARSATAAPPSATSVQYICRDLVFYLGYLWMLWDYEKQTWHDKVADDVVVPADAYR